MIGDETFLPLLLISGRGEGNLVQNLEVNKVLKYKEKAQVSFGKDAYALSCLWGDFYGSS